jgi:hypothetical protein
MVHRQLAKFKIGLLTKVIGINDIALCVRFIVVEK